MSKVDSCLQCKMKIFLLWKHQEKLKLRSNQHLTEVYALVNKGKKSELFAKNFESHYHNRAIRNFRGM